MPEIVNGWGSLPEERIEIRPYVYASAPNLPVDQWDEQAQETLKEFLAAEMVEITYDLNDETDYAVRYQMGPDAPVKVFRISECVNINGVRWHLQPGKNLIPKPVYEYLMSIPEMRKCVVQPGVSRNIGRLS